MGTMTVSKLYPNTAGVKLDADDYDTICTLIGGWRDCDLVIEPKGKPYLYRWYLVPRRAVGANVYLHLQVSDDDDRGLHDHPWDNTSVILAGGYIETTYVEPSRAHVRIHRREPGDVIFRRAKDAHRLALPPGVPYSISLFTTGPVLRDWGFWTGSEWQAAVLDEQERAIRG